VLSMLLMAKMRISGYLLEIVRASSFPLLSGN